MLWRVIQAFGMSSGVSVGAGVIGDIYKVEERGTAIGIFFGVRRREIWNGRCTDATHPLHFRLVCWVLH